MNKRLIALLGAGVIVVAACNPAGTASPAPTGTGGATATATETGGGGPTEGGSLIFAEWQPVSQLNPFLTNSFTSFESLGPALAGLLTIDESGQWTAALATEVPSVENGGLVLNADAPADCVTSDAPTGDCFTLTLHMKPGYKWSDGKDNTLKDFSATYEKAAEWGAAAVAGCVYCAVMVPLIDPTIDDPAAKFAPENRYIKSLEVSDDGLTMTTVWQKNYAGWLGWGSNVMLQADWLVGVTPDNVATSVPVGPGVEAVPWNGPFKITAASTDGIDYVRNDAWGGNKAHLDELHEKFYASKDGMIADFLAGNLDIALDMTQADFPAIQNVDPSIGRATLDSVWQYEHFDLQTAHANLADVQVRTAIAMAVDKQDLVDVLFPGAGVSPACSVAPPGTPWRDDSVQCPAYDPDAANAMLDAAGWTVSEDTGLREKDVNGDGKITAYDPSDVGQVDAEQLRLQLCTTAGNPTRLTELGKLNQYLSAIGIPSDIGTADAASVVFNTWSPEMEKTRCSIYGGTYGIADFAYVLSGDVYGNYYYGYHSSQIPSSKNPGGGNDTRLVSADMDAALEALGFEVDPVKQNALAATIQQVVAQQTNEIPIYYRAETTGLSVHVGGWGVYNPSTAGPTWNTQDWYFIP